MTLIAPAGALIAWVGAALLVVSTGRRGTALALLLAAGGGALTLSGSDPWAAGGLAVGGLVAGTIRLGDGEEGWGILQAGSAPAVILAVVVGVVGAWVATSVLTGPGTWPVRFAALVVIALGTTRLITTHTLAPAVGAAASLALGIGLAAGAGGGGQTLLVTASGMVAVLVAIAGRLRSEPA